MLIYIFVYMTWSKPGSVQYKDKESAFQNLITVAANFFKESKFLFNSIQNLECSTVILKSEMNT